jgi:hypothetical protein
MAIPSEIADWVREYEQHEPASFKHAVPPRRSDQRQERKMAWSNSGKEFEQPPEGPTVGRCVRIIDLGTQDETYQGKAKKQRKTMIGWELPARLMEDGRPFLISKIYTASLNERATLRSDLENWRGKDLSEEEAANFDERRLLGKVCLLGIVYNEKNKAKVSSIMPIPRNGDGTPSMQVPPQVNDSLHLSLEPEAFDRGAYEKLTNWVKEQIGKSPEWAALNGKAAKDYAAASGSSSTPNSSAHLNGKPGSATDPAFVDDIPF